MFGEVVKDIYLMGEFGDYMLSRKVLSPKVRWFAIAVGCFTGIVGSFGLGAGFGTVPLFLVVGAILQSRWPRLGMGLMCAGALWLSFWVFDIGFLTLIEPHSGARLGVLSLISISVLLVILCDAILFVEYLKRRREASCT